MIVLYCLKFLFQTQMHSVSAYGPCSAVALLNICACRGTEFLSSVSGQLCYREKKTNNFDYSVNARLGTASA